MINLVKMKRLQIKKKSKKNYQQLKSIMSSQKINNRHSSSFLLVTSRQKLRARHFAMAHHVPLLGKRLTTLGTFYGPIVVARIAPVDTQISLSLEALTAFAAVQTIFIVGGPMVT